MSARAAIHWLCAGAALLLAAGRPAAAQQHPNVARGLAAGGSFGTLSIDSVNHFNGNLVLAIALGQAYPVNAGFSYGLALHYNSQAWEQEDIDGALRAIPSKLANAGLGWSLSLGRYNPPGVSGDPDFGRNTYVAPDGSTHTFYPKLHEEESAVAGYEYTRGGTYLRWNGATREIEFPDGMRHTFDAWGYPTRIRDRFGNQITIGYCSSRSSCTTTVDPGTLNFWKLTDPHGRVHWIEFQGTGAAHQPKILRQIDLEAFAEARALYGFRYNQAAEGGTEGSPPAMVGCDGSDAYSLQVWLLTQIDLPDGSAYSMPTSSYGPGTGSKTPPCTRGVLLRVKLPTVGSLAWQYGIYEFPNSSGSRQPLRRTTGVSRRSMITAAGVALTDWTYATNLPKVGLEPTGELINTVTDPLGHQVKRYFSVCGTSCSLEQKFEYGLPFSRLQTGDGAGRLLSAEVFKSGSSTPVRRFYVQYERDPNLPEFPTFADHRRLNQRLLSGRTNYLDDGSVYDTFTNSDFDGLGHYRTTTLGGTFAAGNAKTITTEFNPGRGTYPGSFTMLSPSDPWLLHLYDRQSVAEGGKTFYSRACFDSVTGFRTGLRTFEATASETMGTHDVLLLTSDDGFGNVGVEEYLGGDTQSLPTNSACSRGSLGSVFALRHVHRYGVLETSRYREGGSDMPFLVVDRTIDSSTGLPSAVRDTSRLQTTLVYDTLGRPTSVQPEAPSTVLEDGWTEYVYGRATGSTEATAARVEVWHKGVNGASVLAREIQRFDGFGRPWIDEQLMRDGTFSKRETLYNELGSTTSVSALGDRDEITRFESYDPFGRVGTIVAPDGSDVTLTYFGVRRINRNLAIGTSWDGANVVPEGVTTTEIYDRQGRLYQVLEPSSPTGSNITTTYSYDAQGRLIRVSTPGSGATQVRSFEFDGRGFLKAENHPEKAAAPGKTFDVQYENHDARGHVLRVVDGQYDLALTYDAAERLEKIKEFSTDLPLKEWEYWADNDLATNDFRLGKLRRAVRHNRFSLCGIAHDAAIEETYTYRGRMGRFSQRNLLLTFDNVAGESFVQTFGWHALGLLASQSYPECTFCNAPSPRSVGQTYTNGWLSAVGGFASDLTYHPNGALATVSHANATQDVQENDPQSLPRPRRLSATGPGGTLWDSGVYQYDEAGNVVRTGNGYFVYDKVSRLKETTFYLGPLGAGGSALQTASYDAFGNLTAFGGTSGLSTPTDAASNQLCSATCPGTCGPSCGGTSSYSLAGELLGWMGNTFEYDALGMLGRSRLGTEDWLHFYTAEDERVWSYKVGGPTYNRWTLRGLDGQVLREYASDAAGWRVVSDYVYRDGQLLAAAGPTTTSHFHLDHLGTPRAITNSAGARTSYHVYYPFGEEATSSTQDTHPLRFTGHETDLNAQSGATPQGDDLVYMHARHFSPLTGRFLQIDPIGGGLSAPQGWNRYAYVMDRPMVYTDPYGLFAVGPGLNYYAQLGWANVAQDYYYGQGVFAGSGVYQFNTADRLFFGSLFIGSLGSLNDISFAGPRSGPAGTAASEGEGQPTRPCGQVPGLLAAALEALGQVGGSASIPFYPIGGKLALGIDLNLTARADGSVDLYVGGGLIYGASSRLYSPRLGGNLIGRSGGERPSGFGIRASGAFPLSRFLGGLPLGFRGAAFRGGQSRSVTGGFGMVGGMSGALTAGGYVPLLRPCGE